MDPTITTASSSRRSVHPAPLKVRSSVSSNNLAAVRRAHGYEAPPRLYRSTSVSFEVPQRLYRSKSVNRGFAADVEDIQTLGRHELVLQPAHLATQLSALFLSPSAIDSSPLFSPQRPHSPIGSRGPRPLQHKRSNKYLQVLGMGMDYPQPLPEPPSIPPVPGHRPFNDRIRPGPADFPLPPQKPLPLAPPLSPEPFSPFSTSAAAAADLEALLASPRFAPFARSAHSASLPRSDSSSVYSSQPSAPRTPPSPLAPYPHPPSPTPSISSRRLSDLLPPAILPPTLDIFNPPLTSLSFSAASSPAFPEVHLHPSWFSPLDVGVVRRMARLDLEVAACELLELEAALESKWSDDATSCNDSVRNGHGNGNTAAVVGRRSLGMAIGGVVDRVRRLVSVRGREKRRFPGLGARSGSWPGCEVVERDMAELDGDVGMASIREEEGRRYTHSAVERKKFLW